MQTMKHNCFILLDHLRKFSMTQQEEPMCKQDKQRKRMEWQEQNGRQKMCIPLRKNSIDH